MRLFWSFLLCLLLLGCDPASVPTMHGTIVLKGRLEEHYIIKFQNPEGNVLQTNVPKELYDKLEVGDFYSHYKYNYE